MTKISLQRKFGRRVRELREISQLTREELAELIDMSWQNLAKIEAGDRFVTSTTLEVLARTLKFPPYEFFNFEQTEDRLSPEHHKLQLLLKHQPSQIASLVFDLTSRILKVI